MQIYVTAVVFILFDVLSGLLKAFYTGTFNSTNMRKGGMHKLAELLILGLTFYIQLGYGLPADNLPITAINAVPSYIIFMELMSILENLADVNEGLKNILSKFFGKAKDWGDK